MANCANDVWVHVRDNGKEYYWNRRTNTTQWDVPKSDPEGTPERPTVQWVSEKDPGSQRVSYRNLVTGVTTSSLPALAPEEAAPPAQATSAPLTRSSQSIPEQHRGTQPSQERHDQVDPADAWVVVEPDHGIWNYRTGVNVMELPTDARPTWTAYRDNEAGDVSYVFRGDSSLHNLQPGSAVWTIPGRRYQNEQSEELSKARQLWWMQQGAVVAVTGLVKQERFNGVLGTIIGCDGQSRLYVELPAVFGGPVLSLRPANAIKLPANSIVEMVGLKQEQLNGDIGTVVGANEEKERYEVRMRDGSFKAFRPTNLKGRSRLWEIDTRQTYDHLQWRQEQHCLFIDESGMHRFYHMHLPIGFNLRSTETDAAGNIMPKRWPLLVYLHGHGGGTFFTISKRSLKLAGMQFAAERFVVVSPACEWGWRESPSPWIVELVKELKAVEWIDERQTYLTGCSMGGMGTWELAAAHPKLFAAVAPVAAHHKQEREAFIAYQLQDKHVLVIHSDCDDTCPRSKEQPLWDMFNGSENFQKEILRGVDHCSVQEEAYASTRVLYTFLLDRIDESAN